MLDLSKPVGFRGFCDLKIISILENPGGNEESKLVVNAVDEDGEIDCLLYSADGKFCEDSSECHLDLINIKEKKAYQYSLVYWDSGRVSAVDLNFENWKVGDKGAHGWTVIHIKNIEEEIEL